MQTFSSPSDLEEREAIALLGLYLTPCHWSMLYHLLAHPLLSDEELAELLHLERKSVRSSLSTLGALGCLEPIMTSAGKRWRLRERGLRLISAENHCSVRNMATGSEDETSSTLVQRGESWLLQHIQHTAGIYGFFAALAQAARRSPAQSLVWWETGATCDRRYRVGEHWYNLRPDALAEFRAGMHPFRFWLEWDRGTMNARDLAVKFDAYRQYVTSREWARERSSLPSLLCVAPDIAQERRIQRAAQGGLTLAVGPAVWTTTEVLLQANGPIAPIWMHVTSQSNPPDVARSIRRCDVFDAHAGGKDRIEASS